MADSKRSTEPLGRAIATATREPRYRVAKGSAAPADADPDDVDYIEGDHAARGSFTAPAWSRDERTTADLAACEPASDAAVIALTAGADFAERERRHDERETLRRTPEAKAARHLAGLVQQMAESLEDPDADESEREIHKAWVFALFRADWSALVDEGEAPTAKLRWYVELLSIHSGPVRARAQPRAKDGSYKGSGAVSPGAPQDEQHPQIPRAESDPEIAEALTKSVRRFREAFGARYPEDCAALDETHLRRALLTWRDTDRGTRKHVDPRGDWGNRFDCAEKASLRTSFKTTAGMIKKAYNARRKK